jgi:2-dehydro-3-deoxygluconokinase
MPNLIQYCDLLLGGIHESEIVLGIEVNHQDTEEEIFQKWMKAFPKLKTIVTTKRLHANASSNGVSAEFYNGKDLLKSKEYNVSHIIDRIGAGDAFMAGIIYGMITWPENHQKALEFAVAVELIFLSPIGKLFGISTAFSAFTSFLGLLSMFFNKINQFPIYIKLCNQ